MAEFKHITGIKMMVPEPSGYCKHEKSGVIKKWGEFFGLPARFPKKDYGTQPGEGGQPEAVGKVSAAVVDRSDQCQYFKGL